ncbi:MULTISPECIES: TonB-dependent receptor plug domain-containing protein [unclassified Empedobacter]|uniref:TonB-dependent receptor n=1 Tax=unclassified Empedobacter TaxID=2643773 RepID=UPI001DDD467E|nr:MULTISPECIES: TonB-dependent receptor plug domain-containing protein [unclassified Empedobacter]MDM1522522.1 TonB-dependent receptor [Empedobacter sp. 225-1]MDM1542712.1 TonB-dependent receptor [Empedobacter sp. 189-2]HJD85909.1 TonB-dependent receptor [Empedobacter falsenii]
MRLNSTKLLLVGAFALMASLSFAQVVEPTDSTKVEQDENVSLGETLIIGKGVIDIVEDRKTPVAVSTISKASIEDKAVGNVDFPEIFATTPSVYVSGQAGGFGDSQMFLRGFSSQNTAYLLNGQPINGMEDGNLYWSNWSAMTEVANAVQIQRGLGSSKLAISSVGGTVNMVTRATDKKQGGFVRFNTGNDSYMSATISYNTGMKGKWGASFLFNQTSMHRSWAQGTSANSQAYFVSVGYKPNDRHNINFMIFGAPQEHGQNYSTKSEKQWAEAEKYGYGKKYNTTYGYLNGKGENLRTNFYHKPVANLNWDWTINENMNLSTVLYASTGTGGGTSGVGRASSTLKNGLVDFDLIQGNNMLDPDGIGNNGGKDINGVNNVSNGAIRTSVNNHFWYGGVTNLNFDTKTGWNFNLGADVRFYQGNHFQQMSNLFGLKGWSEVNKSNGQTVVVTETFGTNPWSALFKSAKKGQRISRDYSEDINYQGAFGQVEYSNEIFTVFGQGAISNQFYQKFDTWNYGGVEEASKKVNKTGWNVKGGLSVNINDENTVFANAGRYSRQPFLDNVFEYNKVDLREPNVENEEITGFEVGYKYETRNLRVNINAYHTKWGNRFLGMSGSIMQPDNTTRPIYTAYTDIAQIHKGIEIDFDAKVSQAFSLYGFASYGDWKYDGETPFESMYTDDDTIFEKGNVDLTGTYIGEAAQFTFGMGTKVNFTRNLYWDVDFMYNARAYGQVNPEDVVKSALKGEVYQAEKISPFARVNTGVAYEFKFGKQKIKFRGNVRNLFNDQYVSRIDRNGYGYAVGRTWNAGVTYSF